MILFLFAVDPKDDDGVVNCLETILCDPDTSDVILSCHGRTFPAHKAVLSARSDVFRVMFSHQDTAEEESGTVNVEDMRPETLRELLSFIYTDRCQTEELYVAKGLLAAAEKYNIQALKSAASQDELISRVEPDNATSLLAFADVHRADSLRKVALESIMENLEEILESDDWKEEVKGRAWIKDEVLKKRRSKALNVLKLKFTLFKLMTLISFYFFE